MAKDTMPGNEYKGGKHSGDMHEGMKNRAASPSNHGVSPGGHTIDNEACRESTAATPSTLGPRRI